MTQDTPDRWDSDMEPPYSKRIRHHIMGIGAMYFIAAMVVGVMGGIGYVAYTILEYTK